MTAETVLKKKVGWGPLLEREELPMLYAPQTVPGYTPPVSGIDNLGISSTDTFEVPGYGEFTVDFKGYVRVARSQPTSDDWVEAEVYTNMFEMCMRGEAGDIGEIVVTLNPEYMATGQIRTPPGAVAEAEDPTRPAKKCRMAVNALFEATQLGKTFFNKEPIILAIDNVRSIPPAGNPGWAGITQRMLPLYDINDPDGPPAAYLSSLNFQMGSYTTEAHIQEIRQS